MSQTKHSCFVLPTTLKVLCTMSLTIVRSKFVRISTWYICFAYFRTEYCASAVSVSRVESATPGIVRDLTGKGILNALYCYIYPSLCKALRPDRSSPYVLPTGTYAVVILIAAPLRYF